LSTISLRVRDSELAEIDRRAGKLGVTRTAFVLRCALDLASADEQRLDDVERRVARLEELAFSV
jgi:uncharacterized protein (DUF1778 family)